MITMREIEDRYNKRLAAQQAEAEQAERERIRVIEELSKPDLSMEEYIAKRTGKEYHPPEELEKMTMEDYIKARMNYR